MSLTCSVADEIEFESWPEEMRQVAERYFGVRVEQWNERYHDARKEGFNLGYSRGYWAGRSFKEANG